MPLANYLNLLIRCVFVAFGLTILLACQNHSLKFSSEDEQISKDRETLDLLDANELFKRADQGGISPIYAPTKDSRAFRYVTLANRLPVVLVSDASYTDAAATMHVRAGSRHEPESFEGLAHFLEHMLFLGSENYPEAGAFNLFLAENGGYSNAFTTFESTRYFFELKADALQPALKRFADMFSAPKLDQSYVEKEVNAIESEYRLKIRSDARRLDEAEKSLLPEDHPLTKFSVGNRQTLSTSNDSEKQVLMSALHAFYDQYYSASRMFLALAGPQSLDELEGYLDGFVRIKNNGDYFKDLDMPAVDRELVSSLKTPLLVVEKLKPGRTLSLRFSMGDYNQYLRNHALNYIASVLGDEGEDSLLVRLKEKDLVKELSTGVAPRYEGLVELRVGFSLTQQGMSRVPEILDEFYSAVESIHSELENDDRVLNARARYQEYRRITELAVRFAEPVEPLDSVMSLASASHYFSPPELIVGSAVYEDFNAQIMLFVLEQLVPENSVLVLASDQLPGHLKTSSRSKWYDTPYAIYPVSAIENDVDRTMKQELPDYAYLPKSNNYISNDFSLRCAQEVNQPCIDDDPELVPLDKASGVKGLAGVDFDWETVVPLHSRDQASEVYWHIDRYFKQPKASVVIQLFDGFGINPEDVDGTFNKNQLAENHIASRQVLKVLYIRAIREAMRSKAYRASQAGLNYTVSANRNGLVISLGGYSEALPRFAKDLFSALQVEVVQHTLDQNTFAEITQSLREGYERKLLSRPSSRLSSKLAEILLPDRVAAEELIIALDQVTLSDVLDYAKRSNKVYDAQMLLVGNLNRQDVEHYQNLLCDSFLCRHIPGEAQIGEVNTEVRDLAVLDNRSDTVDVDHDDHASLWYFQAEDEAAETAAKTLLLAKMLSADFFNELRTEQQLGYLVSLAYSSFHRRPGLKMSIQSADYSGLEIDDAIGSWLAELFDTSSRSSKALSKSSFERQRSALLADIAVPPKRIGGLLSRWWGALQIGDKEFQRRPVILSTLTNMEYEEFIDFARSLLSAEGSQPLKLHARPAVKPY